MPLLCCSDFGFDPLGLLDPVNSGGFINPQWLQYSEVIQQHWNTKNLRMQLIQAAAWVW